MRISPAAQQGAAATTSARPNVSSGSFTLEGVGSIRSASQTGSAPSIRSVDALLAVQGMEDATERRHRFAGRGRSALDLLDVLKVEILDGRVGPDTLRRLEVMLERLSERSGEPGLDRVLEAIGVRVAVEVAKRKPAST